MRRVALALLLLSSPALAQAPAWVDKPGIRAHLREVDRLTAALEALASTPVDEAERAQLVARIAAIRQESEALSRKVEHALSFLPDKAPPQLSGPPLAQLDPKGLAPQDIDALIMRCKQARSDADRIADMRATLTGHHVSVYTVGLLLATFTDEKARLDAALVALPLILDRGYATKLLPAFEDAAHRARLQAAIAALPPDPVAPTPGR